MTDAEMKSLLLIAFLAMMAFGVRALWGRRTPQPSAKYNWRKIDDAKSGRFFDDVGGDGGETAVNGAD